jgi:WD40 repeat protein
MACWGQDPNEQLGRFLRESSHPDLDGPLPKPRFRHDVPFRTATVSVDRKILIALDAEGFVVGWDAVTAKRLYLRRAIGKDEVPQRLTVSPDGRSLAVSPRSLPPGIVRILETATGKELRRFDRGFSPSFSPDSEFLACSDGTNLRRWALRSGAELPSFPEAEEPLKWTAWSSKSDVIAASAEDSTMVAVWDVASRRRRFRDLVSSDQEAAASLAFTPDGKTLAVGSHWGIQFWSLAGPPERQLYSHEEYAMGPLRFSADGRRMTALNRRRRLLVWETFTGKPLFTWASYQMEDGSLEVSEGGDVAIWLERGGIRLERIPLLLAGYEDGHVVRSHCFTSEGNVITGDDQGTIRIWDPGTQKEIRRLAVPLRHLSKFFRDGTVAVFGGGSDPVQIWDLASGRELLKIDAGVYIGALTLSPDGSLLALGHADGSLTLWDLAAKRERAKIASEMTGISAISWTPDGKSLAWGDDSGGVAIAEGTRGLEPLRFRSRGGVAIRELAFSPDGKTLVATDARGDHREYTGELGREPVRVGTRPSQQTYLPDPRWNASGFLQKRGELGIVEEAFSPDGSIAISVTRSGKLLIWQAPGGK